MTVLFSGCSLQPAQMPAPVSWAKREAQLAGVNQFTLRGRISTNSPTAPGANLFWRQNGERFESQLSGPFGAGAVSISGTPGDVEVRSGEETFRTAQPETWLHQRMGWSLPIQGLRYWIVGLPAPGEYQNIVWDERERIAVLVQSGWTLNFEHYQLVGHLAGRLELPRLLVLERGELRVKLVVDEWLGLTASESPASL